MCADVYRCVQVYTDVYRCIQMCTDVAEVILLESDNTAKGRDLHGLDGPAVGLEEPDLPAEGAPHGKGRGLRIDFELS